MIKDLNKFCNMINDVDSQLYEIAKILKKYDSSKCWRFNEWSIRSDRI